MPYTDPPTVRSVLAPDGDTAPGTAASMSDDAIQESIDEASAEIDGRLGGRYETVPFPDDDVPPLVATIARDISAYLSNLTYRRGEPMSPGDLLAARYSRAETLLGQIASGAVTLNVGLTPPEEIDPGSATVVNPYTGTLFDACDMDLRPQLGFGYRYGDF